MKTQSTHQWFRGVASLLLLFGYFLNVVSFESFHQAVHHHEHADLHTEEAEEDACHRAIYHGETSQDCEHKSHIAETHASCELCKVTVSRFHFASKITKVVDYPFDYSAYQVSSISAFGCGHSLSSSPRGPPAFS